MTNPHADALKARHARVDVDLRGELKRPLPDAAACADLKKRKLAIKDDLARSS